MAGIGFKLQKILSNESYSNLLQGYFYSAVVSSGPVLFTIFSLTILGVISSSKVSHHELQVFRTLVVYIYGTSLVISSPFQMVLTRYMADRIFIKDYSALVPSFVGVSILSTVVHAVIGYIAVKALNFDFGTSVATVALFANVGIIWIAMITISASKDFVWIVKSFMYGSILSLVAGYLLGTRFQLMGLVMGFCLGQILIVIMLSVQIFTEFEYRNRLEFYFLEYFKKYTALAFIATLFNIGIWGDKVVFWFTRETSQQVHSFLRASYVYDVPIFLSYLFIVPALAMFTIQVETSFYIHYKKYFLSILNRHPYSSLIERQNNIINDLKLSMGRILVLQGTISVVGIFLSEKIYNYIGISSINLGVFQIAILAVFLLALLQILLIITLYFDYRTDALILSGTFALTNILFTIVSIWMGFSYYGYGILFSCLTSLVVGFVLFNYRLRSLIYYTFINQKIIVND
ncbi:MAG: hypothetical protein COV46_01250 [Deltaproteobacteria bacterium CG11_big_fil_rev_8_21_14_0_20_49_13]|nr:MAG: hypothetical protein COV46_01250 [Deltaproteobacteria bacterium CG11_big_fil_rev_8_21_14_0_20_49_13]